MSILKLPYFSFLWTDQTQMDTWKNNYPPSSSFIKDLGLREIIENLRLERESRWIVEELLYKPCTTEAVIEYRLDIMDDLLTSDGLFQLFQKITLQIEQIKAFEAESEADAVHRSALFLQKSIIYTEVITSLWGGLENHRNEIQSQGLQKLSQLISQIVDSSVFQSMAAELKQLTTQADAIRSVDLVYHFQNEKITELAVDCAPGEHKASLTGRLIQASERISFLAAYEDCDISQGNSFSPLEGCLLEETQKIYPEYFQALEHFYDKYQGYPMEHLLPFSSELRFFTVMISLIKNMQQYGFEFCKPKVRAKPDKQMQLEQVYDLSLAVRLVNDDRGADHIVKNDHYSDQFGRIFILTGPNQGGKTTFLRSIGIAQVLFQAGCFVPARTASLSPVDYLFTHFQEKEVLGVKKGRLGEEAARIAEIFSKATESSLILLN
ncbi:MAG: hypothetical protein ACE3NC_11295 [Candidatus Wallacebacter cryptica]